MGEKKVVKFRPIKIPPRNPYAENREVEATEFMTDDLAKSGLTCEDLESYARGMIHIEPTAECGYMIPYFYPDGRPIVNKEGYTAMFRTRQKPKKHLRCKKYLQPSGEQLAILGLSGSVPYFPPYEHTDDVLAICEGEKKTISVIKHLGIDAIGIGGCWNWGKEANLHEWILDAVKGKKIILIPDADVLRYDIAKAYGNLAYTLTKLGCDVEIVNPPDKIDDWIVQGNGKAEFDELPRLTPEELNQTPTSLCETYNLAFRTDAKGNKTVLQHTSNIMRLMEQHPAFPTIWANRDTGAVMIGDKATQPDLTEMELANYIQHNLGFEKVSHKVIRDCVRALSKKNARSPFLEWIREQVWDGEERLATWMTRLWGIEDTDFAREVAVKWLVSSIARMERPGTKIDWMFIVVGPQGTGKTSMPAVMFRGNNLVLYGHDNDKDLHMKIHSALCIGFDELDSFGKRETSFLKAMITTSMDHFRPPYGSSVETHERRSVLYGCGNRREFLVNDPSGYRRYAILETDQLLNFAGLEREVDQLWAEAYHLYVTGDLAYWEVDGADANAQDYVAPSLMEDKVHEFIEMWDKAGKEYFTMAELMQFMGLERDIKNAATTRELAGTLRHLGFAQTKRYIGGGHNAGSRRVWVLDK